MNSPTHRENVLSSNYKETGGVLEGNLAGADTTLVVQFFGNSGGSTATIPIAKAQEQILSPQQNQQQQLGQHQPQLPLHT